MALGSPSPSRPASTLPRRAVHDIIFLVFDRNGGRLASRGGSRRACPSGGWRQARAWWVPFPFFHGRRCLCSAGLWVRRSEAPHVWLEAPGRRPVGASVAVEQRGSGRTDRSTGASRVDRFERLVTLCGPASGPRPRCRGPRS